jgi:hypothetical protein
MTLTRGVLTFIGLSYIGLFAAAQTATAGSVECTNYQAQHPEWIWCDDFESDSSLEQNYFEVDRRGGRFGVVTGSAFGGNGALRARFAAGVAEAGGVKLSFGRTPVAPTRFTDRNFDDVYWRFYMKTSSNWTGQPNKLARATIFAASNWSQAAIGHLWEDGALGLGLDPATGVSGSTVVTTTYNDFPNLVWLGKLNGSTQVYSAANRDRWMCIEVHMKLNTPGQSNGQFGFWVDDHLEAQASTLNWRGSYTGYGINAVLLENFQNAGAPQQQDRWVDNFIVSTQRIGCSAAAAPKTPNPPTNVHSD